MKKSVAECQNATFRIIEAIAAQMNIIIPEKFNFDNFVFMDQRKKWDSKKAELQKTIWKEFKNILPIAETYESGENELLLNNRMYMKDIFIKDNIFDKTIKIEVKVFDNKYRSSFNQTIDQIIYLFCNPKGVYALESAIIQLL
jgi:hypothetical protein